MIEVALATVLYFGSGENPAEPPALSELGELMYNPPPEPDADLARFLKDIYAEPPKFAKPPAQPDFIQRLQTTRPQWSSVVGSSENLTIRGWIPKLKARFPGVVEKANNFRNWCTWIAPIAGTTSSFATPVVLGFLGIKKTTTTKIVQPY